MALHLAAEARNGHSKSEKRQYRAKGKIPAVVYGTQTGNVSAWVEEKALQTIVRQSRHAVIELDLPSGGTQPVMIQEMQRDKLNGTLLHIDFRQINMNEPVKTQVALEFAGEAEGVRAGGLLQIQMHEVEIRCLPHLIPGSISVDISKLGIGDHLLVGDISLPAGMEMKSDPQDVAVTVLAVQKEAHETEAEQQAEAAGEHKVQA